MPFFQENDQIPRSGRFLVVYSTNIMFTILLRTLINVHTGIPDKHTKHKQNKSGTETSSFIFRGGVLFQVCFSFPFSFFLPISELPLLIHFCIPELHITCICSRKPTFFLWLLLRSSGQWPVAWLHINRALHTV